MLGLGQFLEIRHRDIICTHCAVNQNWIYSLSTHGTSNCDSKWWFTTVKKKQYGHLVHEVTTFMDMILMARCEEKWITKWLESDDFSVFKFWRFLSLITRSMVFQLHQLSCLRVTSYSLYLDNFGLYVRSVKNQRVINRSMQCFIDGQDINYGNLALGFEQCMELFYLKKCRQRYGFLLLCGLNGN